MNMDDIIDLLVDYLKENTNLKTDLKKELKDELSDEQQIAFEMYHNKENILVLGAGGTGKSKLINNIKQSTSRDLKIVLCATTGVSAHNISGLTINSYMGIGTGDGDKESLLKKIYGSKRDYILQSVDIIVIDEISMMSAELFEKIEYIFRKIKKKEIFFGGVQLILTGDWAQLSPVFKENKDKRLLIQSELFLKHFNEKNTIILKKNFRQLQDPVFGDILSRIRLNNHTKEDILLLKNKNKNFKKELNDYTKSNPIPLYIVATNKKAQEINKTSLNKISSDIHYYKCYTKSKMGKDINILNLLEKELDYQFLQKGLYELQLKKNARVMLIKNIDTEKGLVNGSIGTVIDFDIITDTPIVLFDNNIKCHINYMEWELSLNDNKIIKKQVPLILSWALTIHKTQSLTLNSAILDLQDCFCEHQVYVALSRLKTLNSLFLKSFDEKKITINNDVLEYYKR